MSVFSIGNRGKVFLVAQFFLLVGCIEGQPWQSSSSPGKSDVGQDTISIEDSAHDLGVDVEKGCSPSSCGQGEVCDSVKNICVSCTEDMHCNNGICDDGVCFECVEHSDCSDVGKARCSDNVCSQCDASIQCGHFQGTLSCSNTGTCECNADSDCDGGVCDRRPDSRGSCDYMKTPDSKNQCQDCISDSQCRDGSLCVLTIFDEKPYKYFCLSLFETACMPPYTHSGQAVRSVEGVEMEVCRPTPTRATCDAIVANFKGDSCLDDDDCPTAGLCKNDKCTYACGGQKGECDNQCSASALTQVGYCI